jgi:hypothetical protein
LIAGLEEGDVAIWFGGELVVIVRADGLKLWTRPEYKSREGV